MAQEKLNVMAVGPGNMTSPVATARLFASNLACAPYNPAATYAVNNVVEYSGNVFRSLQGSNVGNTPSSGSAYWHLELVGIQDGDVCFVVNGSYSSIQQRAGGLWGSVSGQPVSVALVDGQLTTADAFTFSGSYLPYAEIQYTIRRGAGQGSKRKGSLTILNDGSGTFQYSHEFLELGTDVSVTLVLSMAGGTFHVGYTSVATGAAITFEYTLKGWA